MRLIPIFLGFLLLMGHGATAWAASAKALSLRQANGLTAFTPPEKFLAGNFVADEMNPGFIFGAVKSFAASRKCPTTWLIESGDKNRPAGARRPGPPGGVHPLPGGGLPRPGGVLRLHRPERLDSPAMDRMAAKNSMQEQDRRAVSATKTKLDTGLHRRVRGRRRIAFHPEERGTRGQISGSSPAARSQICPDL